MGRIKGDKMNRSMVELLFLVSIIAVCGCAMYVTYTLHVAGLIISCITYGTMLYKYLYEK
jgi:hypothetical protein